VWLRFRFWLGDLGGDLPVGLIAGIVLVLLACWLIFGGYILGHPLGGGTCHPHEWC
jgi:hypothetical protein